MSAMMAGMLRRYQRDAIPTLVTALARIATCAAVLSLVLSLSVPVATASSDDLEQQAAEAAQQILDARDRANAAAQAMFDAESELDTLAIELDAAEQHLHQTEDELGILRSDMTNSAVRQFIGAGQTPLLVFAALSDTNDSASATVYSNAASGAGLIRADDFDAAIEEYQQELAEIEVQRTTAATAAETYRQLETAAEAEVLELQELEVRLLADAAVQRELERQQAIRAAQVQRELEAEQQRQADARAALAATSVESTVITSSPDTNGTTANTTAGSDDSSDDSTSDDSASDDSSSSDTPAAPDPAPQPDPEPEPDPVPPPAPSSGIACPVAGTRSFADTWGAPRSGGRRHQGVDMISPGGTPLVAVESGSVRFKTNRLGGNAAWVTGNSGSTYYYAHMSSWEGSNRSVSKGDVIGYVGRTGNAGTEHLHFEVHPGGGSAVNPYPYVRAAC